MAKRAANGMGSIRQRADGRWEARYTAPDGRQRSVFARTQREVSAKLKDTLRQVDSGAWREPSKMTVSDWLEIWLTDYQGDNTERTVLKYRSIVRHNFKPVIGDLLLTKLSTVHLRRMLTDMRNRSLSQVTISNYYRVLKTALNAAIEAKLIKFNPADEITVARGRVKKFHVIEKAQFTAFIDAAKGTRYENELVFLLYSGLRVGELRGLKWSDVDFERKTIFVQRQLHPKSQLANRITEPKYAEERLIYLPAAGMAVLQAQRRRQAGQRLAAGVDWQEDDTSRDLVFRMSNGAPHGEKTIANAVHRAGAAIGLPDLHPHDLRHSYAVAAIRAKMDVKSVQHNLGHKQASMTLDVYVAYTEEAGKEGADKLSAYFSN